MGACSSTAPDVPVPDAFADGVGRVSMNPSRESARVRGTVDNQFTGPATSHANAPTDARIKRMSQNAVEAATPSAEEYRTADEVALRKIASSIFAIFAADGMGVRMGEDGSKRCALELASRVKWKLSDAHCTLLGDADKAHAGDVSEEELQAFAVAAAEKIDFAGDGLKPGVLLFQAVLDAINQVKWDAEIATLESAPPPAAPAEAANAARKPSVAAVKWDAPTGEGAITMTDEERWAAEIASMEAGGGGAVEAVQTVLTDEEKWAAEIAEMDIKIGGGGAPASAPAAEATGGGGAASAPAADAAPATVGVSGVSVHDEDAWAAEIAAMG